MKTHHYHLKFIPHTSLKWQARNTPARFTLTHAGNENDHTGKLREYLHKQFSHFLTSPPLVQGIIILMGFITLLSMCDLLITFFPGILTYLI